MLGIKMLVWGGGYYVLVLLLYIRSQGMPYVSNKLERYSDNVILAVCTCMYAYLCRIMSYSNNLSVFHNRLPL